MVVVVLVVDIGVDVVCDDVLMVVNGENPIMPLSSLTHARQLMIWGEAVTTTDDTVMPADDKSVRRMSLNDACSGCSIP